METIDSIPRDHNEMTVGNWLLTFLILAIPLLNIIMLFVWAFGDGNQTRATYAKATLLWILIVAVFMIIVVSIFGAGIFMLGNGMMDT